MCLLGHNGTGYPMVRLTAFTDFGHPLSGGPRRVKHGL